MNNSIIIRLLSRGSLLFTLQKKNCWIHLPSHGAIQPIADMQKIFADTMECDLTGEKRCGDREKELSQISQNLAKNDTLSILPL